MAIPESKLPLIRTMFSQVEPHGRLMIFGRPRLIWEGAPSPEELFRSFGFDEVHTLDVSPYEGASHMHDLNDPDLPEALQGQYDCVWAGGTLEHIFYVQNAVKVALNLLKVGGLFLYEAPANNWAGHGFYQLSPTFAFDYFSENGCEMLTSMIYFKHPETDVPMQLPIYPGQESSLNSLPARVIHNLWVRKTDTSTTDRIPLQGLYLDKHDGQRRPFRFKASEPVEVRDGQVVPLPMGRAPIDGIIRKDGHYAARFASGQVPASIDRRPFRSTALVYEDGKLLDWIVSDPAMVEERPGSFTHFSGFIHFSPRDGGDPRTNGRQYEVAFRAE